VNEFDAMDEVEVPDQWDEITERSALAGRVETEPRARSRRGLVGGAIAAAVLAVTLVAGLVALDRSGDGDETVTLDTGPAPETTIPEETEQAPADEGDPLLVCPTGELAAGSLPDGAEFGAEPLYTASMVEGVLTWAWTIGDQTVQFNVQGIPWADDGHATEVIDQPPGALVYQPHATVFRGTSDLSEGGSCDIYDVMVSGGSEEDNRQTALDAAEALEWVKVPTVTEPEGVVDARTMRSYTMALAADRTPVGTHRAELWVEHRFSESGVGGRAYMGNPALEPQWIWSGLLRVPGVPTDRDTVTTASVGETGEAFSSSAPYPLGLTDRAETEPIPALIVGTLEE
jgi:hypothetical protein